MEQNKPSIYSSKRYMPNYPCDNGHSSERLISNNRCVKCQREAIKRWGLKNPESKKEQALKWALKRPNGYNEKARTRMREYYRGRHGIPAATRPTPENCECCDRKLEGGKKTHLDHCHTTGKFRGWLCNQCNMGIGALGDNIEGLERALEYLKRSL